MLKMTTKISDNNAPQHYPKNQEEFELFYDSMLGIYIIYCLIQ